MSDWRDPYAHLSDSEFRTRVERKLAWLEPRTRRLAALVALQRAHGEEPDAGVLQQLKKAREAIDYAREVLGDG